MAAPAVMVGVLFAQAPTPPQLPPGAGGPGKPAEKEAKPDSLEKALEEALKNNPDVRLAESKLHEAEAELDRARMQVMQKIVSLKAALARQKAEVDYASTSFKRFSELHKTGAVEARLVDEAEQKLQAAKAKLAEVQTEYDFLLGKRLLTFHARFVDSGTVRFLDGGNVKYYRLLDADQPVRSRLPGQSMEVELVTRPAAPGSIPDKLRKALDQRVTLGYNARPLAEVVKEFQEKHGVPFVLGTKTLVETKVTLQINDSPFGAALEMLEDTLPNVHFAVRDYGVLVTSAERLPPGAVPLYTFWKSRAAANDPDVAGEIKAVDQQAALVTISIGSDAGLKKGHTLFVYRLQPKPRYLGEVRIIEIRETESVGRPNLQSKTETIHVGDKVSSNLSEAGKR
jgi:hypothetical protein